MEDINRKTVDIVMVNGKTAPTNDKDIEDPYQEPWHFTGNTVDQRFRPLVKTKITRFQQNLLEGKQVVVIGGGSYRMRTMWPDAAEYGIKAIAVESDPNHLARKHAYHFIQYDYSDHTKDSAHAVKILKLLHDRGIEADGCLGFSDDYIRLAALISEKLGTKSSCAEAVDIANSKSKTQNVLNMRRGDAQSHTYLFTSESVHLQTEEDCDNISESFKFPAMLKLDNCQGAVGASKVENKDELKKKFREITTSLPKEADILNIGLIRGHSMAAMEFYNGSEHNVDVEIYDGKLVCAYITDSGRVRQPYFIATAKCMPSTLPEDKKAQLIDVAYQCCIGIGLSNGTFNVELIMTSTGPKLVEINARLGGFCLRDWHKELYGVDVMLNSMMIACGIQPHVYTHPANTPLLMGIMVIPSLHAYLLNKDFYRNLLNELILKKEIMFVQFTELKETQSAHDQPFGNIAVSGTTASEARLKLIKICTMLGIDQDEYPVEQFIKHF